MDWLSQLILLVVSLIANAFSAFVGGGAGLIQLPALIFLGLSFSVALATHKVASVALGVGATIRHLRANTLERRFALYILATGLPGVFTGATLILKVPDSLAREALGILTISLAIYSFLRPELGQKNTIKNRDFRGLALGGAVLLLIGVLNGSLTSGTGLFVTLWLVSWFGLDYKTAVAYTLVLVGVFWNGTGALVLGVLGDIEWSWLPALIVGSLLGGYAGAHLSIIKGNKLVKRGFELITLLIGLKLIFF